MWINEFEVVRSNLRKLHEKIAHTRARPMLVGKISMLARRPVKGSDQTPRSKLGRFSSWERGKEGDLKDERASVSQPGGIWGQVPRKTFLF